MIAIELTQEQKAAVAAVDDFCDAYFTEDAIKQWCKSRGVPTTVYNAVYESPLGKYCLPEYLGGRGYTDQSRVGRIWMDCRGNQIAQGTDEVMVHLIAKSLIANRVSERRRDAERIAAAKG